MGGGGLWSLPLSFHCHYFCRQDRDVTLQTALWQPNFSCSFYFDNKQIRILNAAVNRLLTSRKRCIIVINKKVHLKFFQAPPAHTHTWANKVRKRVQSLRVNKSLDLDLVFLLYLSRPLMNTPPLFSVCKNICIPFGGLESFGALYPLVTIPAELFCALLDLL